MITPAQFKTAIENEDAKAIGRCVDFYRFWKGKNYVSVYAMANELTGIGEAEWDELMYCVDVAESEG